MPTVSVGPSQGSSTAQFHPFGSECCGMEDNETARLEAVENTKANLRLAFGDTMPGDAVQRDQLDADPSDTDTLLRHLIVES